mmetsp:Transcript_32586/g.77314  ORF Transcript_32586/g.77314 Transcript_32586/m.77314 type:complete len:285 (+) Transcript_32586:267-1121(+)
MALLGGREGQKAALRELHPLRGAVVDVTPLHRFALLKVNLEPRGAEVSDVLGECREILAVDVVLESSGLLGGEVISRSTLVEVVLDVHPPARAQRLEAAAEEGCTLGHRHVQEGQKRRESVGRQLGGVVVCFHIQKVRVRVPDARRDVAARGEIRPDHVQVLLQLHAQHPAPGGVCEVARRAPDPGSNVDERALSIIPLHLAQPQHMRRFVQGIIIRVIVPVDRSHLIQVERLAPPTCGKFVVHSLHIVVELHGLDAPLRGASGCVVRPSMLILRYCPHWIRVV